MATILKDGELIIVPDTYFPSPTAEEVQAKMINDGKRYVQGLVDKEAQSLGFDSINSITKFIGFPNKYEADAISLRNWCAEMWTVSEASKATTLEELLLELPKRV